MENLSKHYYKLILLLGLITLTLGFIATSCTPDDIVPERQIRYFPVQIITVNCDPSDLVFEDGEAKNQNDLNYDISKVLSILNRDYETSRIQFYQYGEVLPLSIEEYDDFDNEHPTSILCAFINDEEGFWGKIDKMYGRTVVGLGSVGEIQIRANDKVNGCRSYIIQHEMDHCFGWQHEEIRDPAKLYEFSINHPFLANWASDHLPEQRSNK